MASEERERAEETSDKLKEMLVQVSPKIFKSYNSLENAVVIIYLSGASATYSW